MCVTFVLNCGYNGGCLLGSCSHPCGINFCRLSLTLLLQVRLWPSWHWPLIWGIWEKGINNDDPIVFFFLIISNPLHPNISMHILHTVLYTFPKLLRRRICWIITSFFINWWLFPLFLWPYKWYLGDIVRRN